MCVLLCVCVASPPCCEQGHACKDCRGAEERHTLRRRPTHRSPEREGQEREGGGYVVLLALLERTVYPRVVAGVRIGQGHGDRGAQGQIHPYQRHGVVRIRRYTHEDNVYSAGIPRRYYCIRIKRGGI